MATVYRATDPAVGRTVAIKVLARQFVDQPDFRARFQREARAVAALEHPAIVPLYDFGEQDGEPFLVLRYLDGGSLADRLSAPLSPAAALPVLRRVAEALDYAHANGVVHRDVKPANILFDHRGEASLADFGVARFAQAGTLATQAAIGSPTYMSPEQVEGVATPRSDIYSLGCTAFEALTGKPPYVGQGAWAVMLRHRNDPVPSAAAERPELGSSVDFVFARVMAKEAGDRYASATAFVTALGAALSGATVPADRTVLVPPPVDVGSQSRPVAPSIRMQLVPARQRSGLLRRRAAYSLEIENRGQAAVSVSLGGSTGGDGITLDLPPSVTVPANGIVRVVVSAVPRGGRRLVGRRKVHPFTVRGAVGGSDPPATAEGQLEDDPQAAVRPIALATTGFLVLAGSFGAVALLTGGGNDDAASPADGATPNLSPTASLPPASRVSGTPSASLTTATPSVVAGATAPPSTPSARPTLPPATLTAAPPPPTGTTAPTGTTPPQPTPTPTLPRTPTPGPTRTATPTATATPAPMTYTVKAGDTCASIANAFAITVQQFQAFNPAINPECTNLVVGQMVRVR